MRRDAGIQPIRSIRPTRNRYDSAPTTPTALMKTSAGAKSERREKRHCGHEARVQEVHGAKDIKYMEAKGEILLIEALKNPLAIDTSGMSARTVG